MKKPNVIIRMGAAHFDAYVRGADGNFIQFNLRTMGTREQHVFRRELTKAFRIAGEEKK